MMAGLHARGTNITKSLHCDDLLGGDAERVINNVKNIKATDVNKNIGNSTQFARKTAASLVHACLIDLIESGELKFKDVTSTTGEKKKKKWTFEVEAVLPKVAAWFAGENGKENESFGINGLLRLRNHCRTLTMEHSARWGDTEAFECVCTRELSSMGINFIRGMYTEITIDMMRQVVQHSELHVFRMRCYGFTIPSPFSDLGSLVEIDDVIEMYNKWIKQLDKQGLGIKNLTNMSTIMAWIQLMRKKGLLKV
jgi:hypothetical protein